MTEIEADAILVRIAEGIALIQQGDRAGARRLLTGVHDDLGAEAEPIHRVALAHTMADAQDDPADELAWDLRALDAAGRVTDEHLRAVGVAAQVRGMLPSLHLNLGDVYHRLGELDGARHHLALARAARDALDDDFYGRMIGAGIDGLAARLAGAGGDDR